MDLAKGVVILSSKPSGDIIFGALILGVGKNNVSLIKFDHAPGTLIINHHHGCVIGDSRGLLHVMRDNDYRVFLDDIVHQFLDAQRGDWVEGGSGLVH